MKRWNAEIVQSMKLMAREIEDHVRSALTTRRLERVPIRIEVRRAPSTAVVVPVRIID